MGARNGRQYSQYSIDHPYFAGTDWEKTPIPSIHSRIPQGGSMHNPWHFRLPNEDPGNRQKGVKMNLELIHFAVKSGNRSKLENSHRILILFLSW